jgi:hypothetical protein
MKKAYQTTKAKKHSARVAKKSLKKRKKRKGILKTKKKSV